MAVSPRNPMFAPWLDLRAYKIGDPVERLRFLKREMQVLEQESRRSPAKFVRQWQSLLGIGLAVAGVLAAAWPAGLAQTAARERSMAIPGGAAAFAPAKPIAPADSENAWAAQKVWRVDRSEAEETYSNGLHIDLTFAVSNQPRGSYPVFPLNGGAQPVRYQTNPAGIVYHTTESQLDVFEESENRRLKMLGQNLLETVRQERAYNYVIDRFGRVFRVVEESDIANHAGHSVWADPSGIYVNLNDSFLAVSFEGQTGAPGAVTPAQIQAGRMLTEMLRSRYSIPAGNCVTHAQVSVNDQNWRIGNHTDWASQFPFAAVGLPDNYAQPLPGMIAFGFGYDDAFIQATDGRWKGLDLAEAQVQRQAIAEGLPVVRYRAILQHRYTDVMNLVAAGEEGNNEGGK